MPFKYPVPLSVVALATLFLAPPPSLSAQSILLSADEFALLAGTSVSVGGAGPTTISNGNVGAAAGINGFPPATIVNGSTILGGAIVNNALNDLITARNALSAMIVIPANNLTTVNGGNLATQILTPGVYKFDVSASISLNGVLTLDAQGQNNVVWVFNIGTALTTGANAEVRFINLGSNGGKDNGLFWNAGTAFTFGANNIIAGNYLAGTDITFGTTLLAASGSGSGRALALAGVSFDGSGTMDVLGAPARGDLAGGITIENGVIVQDVGYVLLSEDGSYARLPDGLVLKPGAIYSTANAVVTGNSSDTLDQPPATLTVFQTIARLTGTNTYTGGTFIDAGQLTASTANLPTNGAVTFTDSNSTGITGELIFDQPSNGTFGGVISGDGDVIKNGAGMLALTGANTYTGDTLVNDGSLVLAGGRTGGGATIASGAFLVGEGTINGDLLNSGTVSPGFSPGVIVVAGNYTQPANGVLVMEIASAVSFDQLIVGGAASLDGTLQVDILNGFDPAGEAFTFLTAAGGVTGVFSAVPVNGSASVTATVTYNANDVVVSFGQTPFVVFAGTPNQTSVAGAADLSPAITTALNAVPSAAQLPAALNAISPQGYQIWSDIAFAHTASLADRLASRPLHTPGHDNYYFEVAQSRGRSSGDLDVGSATYTSESGLVGGNFAVTPNLTLGAFFEYTESDSGLGSPGSHTSVKDKMPGVRAAWEQNDWFAHAVLGYGFDSYKSTRAINFPGTAAVATSKTTGSQWLADLIVGHRFYTGPLVLSPFAGIQASGWKAKSFTETGAGAFNATVAEQSAESLRTQLGLEAAFDFRLGTASVRPHVRGAWVHELNNDARTMDAAFGGVAYTVETREPQRDSFRVSAGLDVALSERVSLYADYSIQPGDTTRVLGEWRGGLSIGF